MSKLLGTRRIESWELFDPALRMWHAVVFVNGLCVNERWFTKRDTAIAWIGAAPQVAPARLKMEETNHENA